MRIALSLAGALLATTLIAQDVPSLVRSSDAVVRGRVSRIESRWSGDKARIFTEVDVEVLEVLKGPVSAKVTLIQPGGVVDDVGQRVSGVAAFAPAQEVLVFLERRPNDSFFLTGMAQGKYTIERTSDGKAAFAVPDPAAGEAVLLDPTTRQEVSGARKTWALDDLRKEIASAAPTGSTPAPKTRPQPVPVTP